MDPTRIRMFLALSEREVHTICTGTAADITFLEDSLATR